jgi:predicted transcriptional regulator
MKTQSGHLVRASISFPSDIYQSLGSLAKQKKVSLAWVVRDAVERYVATEATEAEEVQKRTVDAPKKLTPRKP